MTDFSDLLAPTTVIEGLVAKTRKALFAEIGVALAAAHGLDADAVTLALSEREKLGSTGFGGGVAIPHGRLAGLGQVTGLFARLAQPIDFEAVDALPVDLVFAMVSPPDAGAEHLKALARVSRRLRDQAFVAKLRGAGSTDALYALWTHDHARDAA
ncbi:MAG: PTS sugar transporter subunit IIA [Sphingomonas sp.]